jgi:hypothetical protein
MTEEIVRLIAIGVLENLVVRFVVLARSDQMLSRVPSRIERCVPPA